MTILVTSGDDRLARERLAQLIKDLRGHTTQREFAKLLGTSYTTIQDWEKQIRLPNDINLERIARLKGWTQEELLRYLFLTDVHSKIVLVDPVERIIAQVQMLAPSQIQQLSDYLNTYLSQASDVKDESVSNKGMNCFLSNRQKHNLHLLLRASLKDQSPTEAMAKAGVKPELFTDIFLRNDKSQAVDYHSLEKLSYLCHRVIQWRAGQLPEVDHTQTYGGETEALFNDLAGDRTIADLC